MSEQENDNFTIASIRFLADGSLVVPINFRVGTPPDHTFVEVNAVLAADVTATIADLRASALEKAAASISALHERLRRERL
jgi:hypothetical protein